MVEYLNELTLAAQQLDLPWLDLLAIHLKNQRSLDHRIFVCGNGGSRSVAEHWGVDLAKVGHLDIYALGTNTALLTAIANDDGYDAGLSTELILRAHAYRDTLICLSCSGRSHNIQSVLAEARKLQLTTYLITGVMAPDYPQVRTLRVLSRDYGVLEDVFGMINHWLARELAP